MLKEYLAEVSETYQSVQDIRVRIQTYKLAEKMSTLPNYVCSAITNNPPPVKIPEVKEVKLLQEVKAEVKPAPKEVPR